MPRASVSDAGGDADGVAHHRQSFIAQVRTLIQKPPRPPSPARGPEQEEAAMAQREAAMAALAARGLLDAVADRNKAAVKVNSLVRAWMCRTAGSVK